MNATQMLELMNRVPFQPLKNRLNNGTVIHVDTPFAIRLVTAQVNGSQQETP